MLRLYLKPRKTSRPHNLAVNWMEAPGIGLGLKNSVRPSLAFDNPREEVDTLLSALRPLK